MVLRTERETATNALTFHAAPLSAENTKGVKNITRKVIKRLEGLGHLEMVYLDLGVSEEEESPEEWSKSGMVEGRDPEEREVEKVLYPLGKEAVKSAQMRIENGMTDKKLKKLRPNLEIPRKVLHASIGMFSFSNLGIIN